MKTAVLCLTVLAGLAAADEFFDDFSSCTDKPDPSSWGLVSKQWGCSNCNGGVSADLVQCVMDEQLGKNVLQLTAHGDLYTGDGPKGVFKNGTVRGASTEFSGWAWPQYEPSCAPHCDVRRVGAAVTTKQAFGGAGNNVTVEITMKLCNHTGVVNTPWLYSYGEVYCNEHTPGYKCPQAYRDQCCNGTTCHTWTDVCRGEWVQNQEIDIIEIPTGATGPTFDPSQISFNGARFTSITALPSVPKAKCGTVAPCEETTYRNLGASLNDGKYHTFKLVWLPPSATTFGLAEFFVDGNFEAAYQSPSVVPTKGNLWIGAWFANAWAGSPDFDTCALSVSSVKVTTVPA